MGASTPPVVVDRRANPWVGREREEGPERRGAVDPWAALRDKDR